MKHNIWIIIIIVSLGCMSLYADDAREKVMPQIEVIYPKLNQYVHASDSTFILGNVTVGANLTINGLNVDVHKQGGFIAFLPIEEGEFEFELIARNKFGADTLVWLVTIPEPFKIVPEDSFAILEEFLSPSVYQELTAGDLVEFSFRGTPGCSAMYKIDSLTDWRPMFEVEQKVKIPGSETIFGSEMLLDSTIRTGTYQAGLYMPADTTIDSANLIFRLCCEMEKIELNSLPIDSLLTDSVEIQCLEDTLEQIITLKSYDYPQIVELKDSVQTIRTGPRKGYLSIFQPAGVRFIADGKYSNYVRMKLAPGQPAWAPDTSLIFMPPGTPAPYSEIAYLRTFAGLHYSRVSVYLDMKLPFRVEYDPERNEMILLIYYATSDTDWIRYDPEDDLIEYITWSQPQEGVYKLTIKLNQDHIWGYECDYEGNVLNLDIKKAPAEKLKLENLKIVIDPGHSADPGAIGPTGLTEAEANLKISRELMKKLRDEGAEVAMTRYDDADVGIYDRPQIAVAEDCDIFISVHNNALPDGVNPFTNNGVSTFYYHLHSKRLAEMIQAEMSDKLDLDDYGHYYANFAVTRPTQYLAVLLECTFMILPEEEARLRGDDFAEDCADAIRDAIEDYLDELD